MTLKEKIKKRVIKRNFKRTFKEELRYGIAAAVGFLIAYAWREPLILFADNIVLRFTKVTFDYGVSIISALLITFFGVIFLFLASRFLK